MQSKIENYLKKYMNSDSPKLKKELVRKIKKYQKNIVLLNTIINLIKNHNKKTIDIFLPVLFFQDKKLRKDIFVKYKDDTCSFAEKKILIELLKKKKTKASLAILLKLYEMEKEEKLLDDILFSLTFFNNEKVVNIILKELTNQKYLLKILTGLTKNEALYLSSIDLLRKLAQLNPRNNFEKSHLMTIKKTIITEFGFTNFDEVKKALESDILEKKVNAYNKRQKEINDLLNQVRIEN
ncbi:MAG: hypothetical protein U9O98_05905 [Asgard group archaeon]|nr:hypothetical protein [Asgard group archaeon]